MIKLHKLNGDELYLNPDLFERIEQNPDTRLTLINSHLYIVKESPNEIIKSIVNFRGDIMNLNTKENKTLKSYCALTEGENDNG